MGWDACSTGCLLGVGTRPLQPRLLCRRILQSELGTQGCWWCWWRRGDVQTMICGAPRMTDPYRHREGFADLKKERHSLFVVSGQSEFFCCLKPHFSLSREFFKEEKGCVTCGIKSSCHNICSLRTTGKERETIEATRT